MIANAHIVLILLLVTVGYIRSDLASEQFILSANDSVNSLVSTRSSVNTIAEDLYVKGNLLFIDGTRLRTTNLRTITTTIVGRESSGYREDYGTDAYFQIITGFVQLTPDQVIVSDGANFCMRLVNRKTRLTSQYAGKCRSSGYADGTENRFDQPFGVIKDMVKKDTVIVADSGNNALRSIHTGDKIVTTLVKLDRLVKPQELTQEIKSGDLFITSQHAVWRFFYAEQRIALLAGSSSSGFQDGNFHSARFNGPWGILKIAGEKLIVADEENRRLRLIDLNTKSVSSICTGSDETFDGKLAVCRTKLPSSMVIIGKTLFLGTRGKIRKIEGKSGNSITTDRTHLERAGYCEDKNYTKIIPHGKKTATVQVVPGIDFDLGIGHHTFRMDKFSFKCKHHISVVEDAGVLRRLSFIASYKVKCSAVSGEVAHSTLASVAQSNFQQLNRICGEDCHQSATEKPAISCSADTLTIIYPTNVTFTADYLDVPYALQQKIKKRQTGAPILQVFILNHQPPVVFPQKNADGHYVDLTLVGDCRDAPKQRYNSDRDVCE